MLQALAILTLLLTFADHWTTYLCLRTPIAGWQVVEANPAVDLLFRGTGLIGGLLIDSIFTVFAVGFVLYTQRFQKRFKHAFLAFIVATTGYAVANNLQAISALGISPLGLAQQFESAELPAVGAAGGAVAAVPLTLTAEATPADPDERAVLKFLRARHTGMSRVDEENVSRAVVREAHRHGLDPALVLAVIQVESSGYFLAVSHVGAMGLMQLLPATAEELAGRLGLDWRGPDSLFDPVLNVQLGTAYIKFLAEHYDGDVSTALAAYNWGPTRIDRRIRKGAGVPSIYTERVMKAFDVASSRREIESTRG